MTISASSASTKLNFNNQHKLKYIQKVQNHKMH